MKKIAVIGPDQQHTHAVASQLTRCKAIVGAGPGEDLDGVVAVVGSWTPEDQRVVDAISQAMGAVVLYRPAKLEKAVHEKAAHEKAWPQQPGVYHCTRVADVQDAVDAIALNKQRWEADARRADLERTERVRVAVKLEMNRAASEIINEYPDAASAHRAFVQRLRLALLRQGVACPSIPEQVGETKSADVESRMPQLLALGAGVLGGLAVGFAFGRMLGQPWWGVAAGLLLALLGAAVRVWMVRSAERQARSARQAALWREKWVEITTDVLTRVQIPRVADAVGGR